ncbi:MAG: hypothetical protein L6R39_006497 [Caloplaca ligustica]|nr:MAG: hypothetical protein L6R39_006497 [Caloplaca ligustica]
MPSFFSKLGRRILRLCQKEHQEEPTEKPEPPKPIPTSPQPTLRSTIRSPQPASSVYSRPSDGGSTYTTKARRARRGQIPSFQVRTSSSMYSRNTNGSPYSSQGMPVKRPSRPRCPPVWEPAPRKTVRFTAPYTYAETIADKRQFSSGSSSL